MKQTESCWSGPQAIEELIGLATSAGARVADIVTGRLRQPNAHSFAGSGKVEEIREHVAACHADVVLVNHPLTTIGLDKFLDAGTVQVSTV